MPRGQFRTELLVLVGNSYCETFRLFGGQTPSGVVAIAVRGGERREENGGAID